MEKQLFKTMYAAQSPARATARILPHQKSWTRANSYGDHEIRINKRDLERDINSGKVKDVKILEHEEVVGQLEGKRAEAQARYDQNPTAKNKVSLDRAELDITNAKRDREVLIKGTVPAKYVKVTKKK